MIADSILLARLRERIVAFAASQMQRDCAEDLAQEVLIVLSEKYGHLDRIEDLLPLSLQIMRFKIMASRRKSYRHGEHSAIQVDGDLPLADSGPDPEEIADRKERVRQLGEAMQKLGERCRKIIAWKLEGKSFPQIQKLLEAESVNTVYTWDFRCRKQLLELMGGSWEGGGTKR